MLKVWAVKHPGHYPVGACTVVVAASKVDAAVLLAAKLKELSLPVDPSTWDWEEINTKEQRAVNILDGEY